jgi:Hsp20/alpha crystallin family
MCDYSLHHVSSRPARVADKLVTTELAKSRARGFAAVGELGAKLVIHDSPPEVAVCLLPGTELAFDDDVRYDRGFSLFGKARVNHKVASFRQIDSDDPHVHYDALEFPNGQIVKVSQLVGGQTATVLQLPVATQQPEPVATGCVVRSDSRVALNRVSFGPGMASILMPNQGAVMLWQTLRDAAIKFSISLVQSLRRLKAHKRHLVLMRAALPAGVDTEKIEASFKTGVRTGTVPKKSPAQKPEKKIEIVRH